ncbi:MAG: hypothetical protein ABI678_00005, partial [Kofleriaceae bacterium]
FGVTTTGIDRQPLDLSAVEFATYSRSHGNLVRLEGEGEADGTFSVPVSDGAGSWELETHLFGTPYFAVGDARHPTLDRYALGRLDGVLPSVETDVTLDVTGLAPWADGDTTQIVVGNNGAVVFSPEFQFAIQPAEGDTAITGQTIDWMAQFPAAPLVEADEGDVAVVTQLVNRTSGSETYQALDRAGTATGFTQTDGAPSTMTVAMSAVAQSSLPLHWRGSQFEALRAEVGAGAVDVAGGQGFFIDALPDAAELGFYATAPDLMLYTPSNPSTIIDATVMYGNPYANQGTPWDEFAIVQYLFAKPVKLGTAAPYNEFVGYQANLAVCDLHDGIVAPRISPVRDVRIAGRSLGSAQTGVGASPTVRWERPRIGRATQYLVTLRSLGVTSSGTTSRTTVATFVTKERSLHIPSGLLAPGGTYVLAIAAIDFGDVDRTIDLFGDGLPFVSAGTVTATFAP